MPESASIKAIKLTRTVFESIHGNLGLLKFSVDELKAKNGTNGEDSKLWHIVCSFYETLGSQQPSKYEVEVNLNDNTVSIKKIGTALPEKTYTVTETPSAPPIVGPENQ